MYAFALILLQQSMIEPYIFGIINYLQRKVHLQNLITLERGI